MDLEFSEEQRLLRDSVARFLGARYGAEDRRRYVQEPAGFSVAVWRDIAELGWLGLAVPEEHGGLGGGAVEVGIVMESLGRALALEPYLQAILSAHLLAKL